MVSLSFSLSHNFLLSFLTLTDTSQGDQKELQRDMARITRESLQRPLTTGRLKKLKVDVQRNMDFLKRQGVTRLDAKAYGRWQPLDNGRPLSRNIPLGSVVFGRKLLKETMGPRRNLKDSGRVKTIHESNSNQEQSKSVVLEYRSYQKRVDQYVKKVNRGKNDKVFEEGDLVLVHLKKERYPNPKFEVKFSPRKGSLMLISEPWKALLIRGDQQHFVRRDELKLEKIPLEQDSSLWGDFIKHLNKYLRICHPRRSPWKDGDDSPMIVEMLRIGSTRVHCLAKRSPLTTFDLTILDLHLLD
ncbi:hypothetical protein CR513_05850, partial [Mucuna pruriens]